MKNNVISRPMEMQEMQQEFYGRVNQAVRRMVRAMVEMNLKQELTEFLNAMPYERTKQRKGHRNGKYQRTLETIWGMIEDLEVPRIREEGFRSRIVERYQRRQPEVDKVVGEMFVRGISTANVREVTDLLWDRRTSPSTVSRIFRSLQQDYVGWKNRPLEAEYLYIWLDGTYFKVRYEKAYERIPILAAIGLTTAGKRELIGFTIGDKESYEAWKGFLHELKGRGLEIARLFITDGAPGLIKAVEEVFSCPTRQRCMRHRLENVLAKVPARLKKQVGEDAKSIFYQDSYEAGKEEARRFFEKWEAVVPEAADCLREHLEECLVFYKFPKEHWRYLRTTNSLESVFGGVKRRTKAMGSFTNETSLKLVLYAMFRRMNLRGVPILAEGLPDPLDRVDRASYGQAGRSPTADLNQFTQNLT